MCAPNRLRSPCRSAGWAAALRVGVQLLPEGAQTHLPWIVFLTLINVVYGAFIAFRQRDFKYVIGFSSVSHMGLVSMGFATMNLTGMTGAGLQMFSHGAMTALFFGCVGMVYDRAHTRDIPSLGGFAKVMPWVAFAFIVGGLTTSTILNLLVLPTLLLHYGRFAKAPQDS